MRIACLLDLCYQIHCIAIQLRIAGSVAGGNHSFLVGLALHIRPREDSTFAMYVQAEEQ